MLPMGSPPSRAHLAELVVPNALLRDAEVEQVQLRVLAGNVRPFFGVHPPPPWWSPIQSGARLGSTTIDALGSSGARRAGSWQASGGGGPSIFWP